MILPHEKQIATPRTVADALTAIARKYRVRTTRPPNWESLLWSIRRTCRRVSVMLELPLTAIHLDDLVELNESIVRYIERTGQKRQIASQYCYDLHRLLDIAHDEFGWTSKAYELRRAWVPIREAFTGRAHTHRSIVEFAIKAGSTPEEFSNEMMEAWKEKSLANGRSFVTVLQKESDFRSVLRRAKMHSRFPNFNLASKNPAKYCLKLKDEITGKLLPDVTEPLRTELLEVVRWKTTTETLEDRDADLIIRAVTGESLLKYLVRLYSYATVALGMEVVSGLVELLSESIVCGFADFLGKGGRCKPQSIICQLSSIHHLTRTYPGLKSADWGWFRAKLGSLRREKHNHTQARKLETIPDYEKIAGIAPQLLALRTSKTLSELETGWLIHDALIFMSAIRAPHRSRNLREVTCDSDDEVSVSETEITSELLSEMSQLAWREELRGVQPGERLYVFHALEGGAKAGREIWEPWPKEAVPVLKTFIQHYRPLLLKSSKSQASTLFFARNGRPFTQDGLLRQVNRICVRFTGERMKVKDFRDLVSAHLIAVGADVEEVSAVLWHIGPYSRTTPRFYIGGFNTSDSVGALEDEIETLLN